MPPKMTRPDDDVVRQAAVLQRLLCALLDSPLVAASAGMVVAGCLRRNASEPETRGRGLDGLMGWRCRWSAPKRTFWDHSQCNRCDTHNEVHANIEPGHTDGQCAKE